MANEYGVSKIANHLYKKACLLRKPLSGTFELSPLCNMSCQMCYIHQFSTKKLIELKKWLEISKIAKNNGMLYLLLTGGEPFLIKGFKEFYIELYRLGLIISINSNATLIDEKTVEWLKLYPPERINITVYGGSNDTYERLCHYPNGFEKMKKAVLLLKEVGINIKFNITLTPENKDDLESIVSFCKEMEYPVQFSSYMFPRIRNGKDEFGNNEARFTPEEAAEYYLKYLDLYYGKEEANIRKQAMIKDGYALDFECEVDVPGSESQCAAGRCAWWLSWEGKLSGCGMFTNGDIDVFELGFEKAWEKVVEKTNSIYLAKTCHECMNKSICHPCLAISKTETGKFEGIPEYRCQMTQAMIKKIINGR